MMRRSLIAWAFLSLSASPLSAQGLVSPISTDHAPYAGANAACKPAPTPVLSLKSQPYYSDSSYSKVDPEAFKREQEAAKPLDDFLRVVQSAATDHRRGKPGAAACALKALDDWAAVKALLGEFTQQGGFQRKWTVGGAALAYLGIRDAEGLDADMKARVAAWLGEVGRAVRPYYDKRPAANRNNHDYWAALSVAATGLAANDRAMVEWGVARLRLGLSDIAADGSLPREIARKQMALHYQLFSLPPLAAVARIAEVNGMGLNEKEQAALDRLARFTFAATQDQTEINRLAGIAQDDPMLRGRPALVQGVGIELWLLTKPGGAAAEREIDAALQPFRPYRMSWLGGDVAALWAAR
ncbi:MAG TPA: alginate lyase family protein [Alphaproteobacteria bacterium]|nr:alginate lyase family protein [Alphaproteobacteria bacterium]